MLNYQLLSLLLLFSIVSYETKYLPTWKSIDSRPLPKWFDNAKIGIFMHWGVYSVPAFGDYKHESAYFWQYWKDKSFNNEFNKYMKENYPPNFTYADFASLFKADLFNENDFADLIAESGARYFVFTSKHHDGFCNWDTKYSFNWNSIEVGPNTDIVRRLANAIRKRTNVTFGLYHSLFEWYNPLYVNDKKNKFETNEFVKFKVMTALKELVNNYKPAIIWSDGQWEASAKYWSSLEFLTWLYNDSPVKDLVVTNDRWGNETLCKHGGFLTCNDKYKPAHLLNRKWEMCTTLDRYSWGYRREMNPKDVLSIQEILLDLVSTVSNNGNYILNIGPRSDGTISIIFKERLLQMGSWLKLNSEAIYSSEPWIYQIDNSTKNVWYTQSNKSIYAIFVNEYKQSNIMNITLGRFPKMNELQISNVELLGYGQLKFSTYTKFTVIYFNNIFESKFGDVLKWAMTLKINTVKNDL